MNNVYYFVYFQLLDNKISILVINLLLREIKKLFLLNYL